MRRDLYGVLNLTRYATPTDIKNSYNKLVRRWHPDKNLTNKDDAEKKFKEISHAFKILGDVDKKQLYDEKGVIDGEEEENDEEVEEEWFNKFGKKFSNFNPNAFTGINGFSGMDALFENLFNKKSGVINNSPGDLPGFNFNNSFFYPNGDYEEQNKKENKFTKEKTNVHNEESDNDSYSDEDDDFDLDVEGDANCTFEELYMGCKKKVKVNRTIEVDGVKKKSSKTLNVVIEPGERSGHVITFDKLGHQKDERVGNINVTVNQIKHLKYSREKDDLHYELEISPFDAMFGFTKTIQFLDGTDLEITLDYLQNSKYKHIIEGKGMKARNQTATKKYGNLIVNFLIVIEKMDPKHRESMMNLLKN
jgi:DnaJ-class molecular chaperone